MDLLRSLYIHIPFCDNICSYCDFSHLLSRTNYQKRYLARLKEDISKIKDKKLYSIYIGGGTPSSLSKEELEDLLSFLYSKFEVVEEFSFEANPESIDEEKVKVLVKYGVNRVSLGVQTVDEKHLKLLNRHHDIKTIKKACDILHRYNLNNINFDFIYGLEDEDESNIEKNIAFALENDVKHISYYSLQVEEGTVLYNSGYKVDDDKLATYYEKIVSRLEEVGFKRYEVSNFAKEGYESKHNLVYWQNKEYYGEGLSASMYIDNIRETKTRNIIDYLNGEKLVAFKEVLTKEDDEFNYLMLNLRLIKGFSLNEFKNRYKKDFLKEYRKEIEKIKDSVVVENDYFRVKSDKIFILDSLLVDLLHFKD